MAILKIRKYGDPILRKKAVPIKSISKKVVELTNNMIETMYALEGIGLAAVQVGVSKKIIVFALSPENKEKNTSVIINPQIISKKGEKRAEEGCLSIPGVRGTLSRSKVIEVKGLNLEEKEINFECSDLLARVIQHEIDHLNGILFIDYLDKEIKSQIKPVLDNLKKESQIKLKIKNGKCKTARQD